MTAGPTYTPIATTTGSGSTSIDFTSITSSYTDLVIVCNLNNSRALRLRFNSDTSSNYSYTYIQGDSGGATSGRSPNDSRIFMINATGPAVTVCSLNNYSNTTTQKTALMRSNDPTSGNIVYEIVGLWRSTAAISAINITSVTNAFTSTDSFTLYGIVAA